MLTEQLKQVKTNELQSKERVEQLVLGLGKESADAIAMYEQRVAEYEAERVQLVDRIKQLSSSSISSSADDVSFHVCSIKMCAKFTLCGATSARPYNTQVNSAMQTVQDLIIHRSTLCA